MTNSAPQRTPDAPAPERKAGSSKRRIALLVLVGLAVAAGLFFGLPAWLHARNHESTNDAFVEGHVVPVSTRIPGHVVAVHVDSNRAVAQGDLLLELDPADHRANLKAARAALAAAKTRQEAAGVAVELAEVAASTGLEAAEAGVREAQARRAAAATGVKTAESELAQARVQVDVAVAAAEEAVADVAAKAASAEQDRADLARATKMVESRSSPAQVLDHARTAADRSAAELEAEGKHAVAEKARVEQARAAVAVAESVRSQVKSEQESADAFLAEATARRDAAQAGPKQVAAANAALQTAVAEVDRAQAAVETQELLLAYTEVRAPVAGWVTKKGVEVGQYAQPGQALLTLVPADVWVVANFKETQLARIRPGQPVVVAVDAWPDRKFAARVDSVQRGTGSRFSLLPPENATGNYVKVVQRVPVKIVFDPPPDLERFLLVPGMSVVPEVDVSGR